MEWDRVRLFVRKTRVVQDEYVSGRVKREYDYGDYHRAETEVVNLDEDDEEEVMPSDDMMSVEVGESDDENSGDHELAL